MNHAAQKEIDDITAKVHIYILSAGCGLSSTTRWGCRGKCLGETFTNRLIGRRGSSTVRPAVSRLQNHGCAPFPKGGGEKHKKGRMVQGEGGNGNYVPIGRRAAGTDWQPLGGAGSLRHLLAA